MVLTKIWFKQNIDCMHFCSCSHRCFLECGHINIPYQVTKFLENSIMRHNEAYCGGGGGADKHAPYWCVSKPVKFILKSLFSCQGEAAPPSCSCLLLGSGTDFRLSLNVCRFHALFSHCSGL